MQTKKHASSQAGEACLCLTDEKDANGTERFADLFGRFANIKSFMIFRNAMRFRSFSGHVCRSLPVHDHVGGSASRDGMCIWMPVHSAAWFELMQDQKKTEKAAELFALPPKAIFLFSRLPAAFTSPE